MIKKPITKNGYERLCKELDHLIDVERPRIINAVSTARALGDLSENAEYHAARDKQRQIESEITRLQFIKAESNPIDISSIVDKNVVRFGAVVMIYDSFTEKELEIVITSEYESEPENNLISISSPMARVLIGKKIGDVCTLLRNGINHDIEILDINY